MRRWGCVRVAWSAGAEGAKKRSSGCLPSFLHSSSTSRLVLASSALSLRSQSRPLSLVYLSSDLLQLSHAICPWYVAFTRAPNLKLTWARNICLDRPPLFATHRISYHSTHKRRQAREERNDARPVPQVQEVGRCRGCQGRSHQGQLYLPLLPCAV